MENMQFGLYICTLGGGGVTYLDSEKLENSSYYIICRIIVPNTWHYTSMQTR